ncbi:MAG: hypothetical protein M1820_006855 [Bogoriella megaspora]|nr:MAG: hypothetical protein M1820_006855 [Bogoriella megaspora]
MSTKTTVPNAWDDDWENLADKQESAPPSAPQTKISKAERREQHAKENKQLWDLAESSQDLHFLKAKEQPPFKAEFKPAAVKVLSRKPQPKILSKNDPTAGVAVLSLEDEDDSEEEARKKREMTFAERQAKAQQEREEKQRKYNEAREKIFGAAGTGTESAPTRTVSPRGGSNAVSQSSKTGRRGRGRGGRDRGDSQPSSSADQSPSRPTGQNKQLYEPGYSPKPSSTYLQKREARGPDSQSRPSTPAEGEPIRSPRGPDGSGRGGFGFANRGNRAVA